MIHRPASLLALVAFSAAGSCGSASPPAAPRAEAPPTPPLTLPLAEVSGLALTGGPDRVTLLAVGDEDRALLSLPWAEPPAPDRARLEPLPVPAPPGRDSGSQFEAIAATADGHALVLDEARSLVHVLSLPPGAPPTLRHTLTLVVPADHPLAPRWHGDPQHGPEGLLPLPGGHLLIARQRSPLLLVEFGPAGAAPIGVSAASLAAPITLPSPLPTALVPLAAWAPDADAASRLGSLNDLAASPDGALYLLASRPSATLVRVTLPLDPTASTFRVEALRALAAPPGGKARAEGLAFLPDGRVLVAFDDRAGRPNLAVFAASP